MDPLNHLTKSIPEWQVLLDDLNGKIARRQGELAEAENSRPSTRSLRSLRNKGSTESLRPKEDTEAIPEDVDIIMNSPTDTPQTNNDTSIPTITYPSNGKALSPPPPPPKADNSPRTPQRNPSNRLRGAIAKGLPALTPPVLRKRKTESLASAESGKPKHRTRSMIIVYYDSAVQKDFETLVKHISASRNSMRKGKMAARMASMRMMADLEKLGDEPDTELEVDDAPAAAVGAVASASTNSPNAMMASASPGDEDDDGLPLPPLNFVSTRRMGPMRELSSNRALRAGPGAPGVRRAGQAGPGPIGAGRVGAGAPSRPSGLGSSIFDELDSGLEWCQSMYQITAARGVGQGRRRTEGRREGSRSRAGDQDGTPTSGTSDALKSEPQLPRTLKQIQIRREAEKMFEKPEKPAQKPAQKSLEVAAEKPPKGLQVNLEKDGGSGNIEVDDALEADDTLEADDDVMDEDAYRKDLPSRHPRGDLKVLRRTPAVRRERKSVERWKFRNSSTGADFVRNLFWADDGKSGLTAFSRSGLALIWTGCPRRLPRLAMSKAGLEDLLILEGSTPDIAIRQASNMPDSDKANLARIRDNQRRSRARRKEYLQELEGRLRQCELTGVEASSEIQGAARKVIEENRRLRLLLAQHGVSPDDASDEDGSQQWPADTPRSDDAQALEMLLNIRRWKCGDTQGSPPETRPASTMPGEQNIDMVASPPAAQATWMPSPESMEDQGAEQIENSRLGLNTLQTGWAASQDDMQYQGIQKLESDPCTPVSSYSFSNQCCGGRSCTSNPREQQTPLQQQPPTQAGRLLGAINMLGPMSTHEEQRKAFDFAVQAQIDPNQYRYIQQLHALYDPNNVLYDPSLSIYQQAQARQIQLPVRPGPSFQTPPYAMSAPRSAPQPQAQAVGTNSCIYATDMITAIATNALPSDVRTDLGCSPQCSNTDCEDRNYIITSTFARWRVNYQTIPGKLLIHDLIFGSLSAFGPSATFNNSDDFLEQDGPDGPASDDDHQYVFDPWGRLRERLISPDDPFVNRDVNQGEPGDGRATDVEELPEFGNFGPYFRRMTTQGDLTGKHIAPKNIDGKYQITRFIDEELRKDPFARNAEFDDWRREVEFQFGERPPPPPPHQGPGPRPEHAIYDFSSLAMLFKNDPIQPLPVPQPLIRSPLAPQKGTDEEMDADYGRINSLPLELCASWWIAHILWFMGEDDASLIKTIGMIEEGSCPAEVFPFDRRPENMDNVDDYEFEHAPLMKYEPLLIVDNRPDPIENSIWVPKLKGVNGSAVRFMRPPFPETSTLDTRYFPVPALQSTVLPERRDIGRPELKLWDGIPGHTFRLPPYFSPDDLQDKHLDGDDRPFGLDIRRIPALPLPSVYKPPPPQVEFRPTRRLNTVYRDRTKVPQNPNRAKHPGQRSPTPASESNHGPDVLGGGDGDGSPDVESFLQDEYEYDMDGDIWGPVGGFEGRDYDAERQQDHDRWYRYFVINNDPGRRNILINGVQVKPGAIAGPLPEFAMFELGDQAAFWFGVGGRNYDPNTRIPPEKRGAENEAPGGGPRAKIPRTGGAGPAGEATGGASGAEVVSPVTAAIAGIGNLQLGRTQNQPVKTLQFRGDAPEFIPGALGRLERLGLRGGAGTEADLNRLGTESGTTTPSADQVTPVVIDENTRRVEASMGEAAAVGELLPGGTPQEGNAGTPQQTNTEIQPANTGSQQTDTGTQLVNSETPQQANTRAQQINTQTPQYMMQTRAFRNLCRPFVGQEKIAPGSVKGRGRTETRARARARAKRMTAAVSENSELEQRQICEGLGIIIKPKWNPARIRKEIARLYETAYQELKSNNNAATEYEAAMGLSVNKSEPKKVPAESKILFFLASRFMYRKRSAPGLKILCGKYRINVCHTWDSERVIIEIIRAVERQRRIGRARTAAYKAEIAASIATKAAIEAETAAIRAAMANMANAATAKTVPTVIDLTHIPPYIDLTHSP
ncbi:hypothetical protein V495_02279 [Pseudogymnoascus sp. VKM F-4514 (FW-929)]|nr:hypothetical protein V495_02279 [Pseudogymnoascus sp. VKM F-4514 (FW-929)]